MMSRARSGWCGSGGGGGAGKQLLSGGLAGGRQRIRFAFPKRDVTLDEAEERLRGWRSGRRRALHHEELTWMSKKKRRPQPQSVPTTSRHLIEGLQEAGALMRRRRWIEARDLLEPLQLRYPGRVDVLTLLLGVYGELRDTSRYQIGCECLLS